MQQCHTPTEDSLLSEKANFYSLLEHTLLNVTQNDVVMLMDDFNAQIARDNINYENILGKHATGHRSENGELLLEICSNFDLKIGGSVFSHKNSHKITWVSPRTGIETRIHHICVSRKFFYINNNVRNKRRADIGSDQLPKLNSIRLQHVILKQIHVKNSMSSK